MNDNLPLSVCVYYFMKKELRQDCAFFKLFLNTNICTISIPCKEGFEGCFILKFPCTLPNLIVKVLLTWSSFSQKFNAALNFASEQEANNFKNELEKKLNAKQQRRQGTQRFRLRKISHIWHLFLMLYTKQVCTGSYRMLNRILIQSCVGSWIRSYVRSY